MNVLISLLLVALTLYASVSLTPVAPYLPRNLIYFSRCDSEKTYRIADVDPRFNLSHDRVRELLKEAADVWNEAAGRQLLSYQTDGRISVSMSFDLRQELGVEAKSLEDSLTDRRDELKNAEAEYSEKIKNFEIRLEKYRDEVAEINARGGASPQEYERLTRERESLEAEARVINEAIGSFNRTTREYNAGVNEYRETVDSFNAEIGKRPEEGVYDPNDDSITLYLYTDETELLHTMIHEFGHAVGIDHLDDPQAVMHVYANGTVQLSQIDRDALEAYCSDQKYTDLAFSRLRHGAAVLAALFVNFSQKLGSPQ